MKKVLGIVVLGLLWRNTSFVDCIGDCWNGQGIFTYDTGKYVGEFKDSKMYGLGILFCQ